MKNRTALITQFRYTEIIDETEFWIEVEPHTSFFGHWIKVRRNNRIYYSGYLDDAIKKKFIPGYNGSGPTNKPLKLNDKTIVRLKKLMEYFDTFKNRQMFCDIGKF
jgi:hypothetical protein